MAVQILFRRGTASDWTSVNPILGSGEPGFETDTGKFKIGDGVGTWSALPYAVSTGGGATNLDGLTDVVLTSPSTGQVLKYNGSQWINGTDSTGGGSGTVTNVSVASANGFAGSVSNASTTPQITLSTSVTGLLKGNGTSVSTAIAGTDYQTPVTLTTTGSSGAATLVGSTLNIPQYSAGGGATSLSGLSDVSLTTLSTGQVLKWSGTSWINDTDLNTGSGSVALNDITDVVLTSPTTGQVLKFNGTAWVNDTDNSGTSLASLDDVPGVVLTSPTTGQVLKFNGTSWVNDTDATGGSSLASLDDVPGVVLTSPTTGQVLKYDGTNWVNDTDSTALLFSRTSVSGTSSTLTDGASENINITGFKSYALLKIQTSAAAWVRLYSDAASRTADQSRLEGVDPLPGAGVIAEVITTTPQTIIITPGTIGFNNEGTPTTSIPVRVTNKSGSTDSITVTITLIQLEA